MQKEKLLFSFPAWSNEVKIQKCLQKNLPPFCSLGEQEQKKMKTNAMEILGSELLLLLLLLPPKATTPPASSSFLIHLLSPPFGAKKGKIRKRKEGGGSGKKLSFVRGGGGGGGRFRNFADHAPPLLLLQGCPISRKRKGAKIRTILRESKNAILIVTGT